MRSSFWLLPAVFVLDAVLLAAAPILCEHLLDLKIRVVSVVDLMRLQPKTGDQVITLKQQLNNKLIEHKQYINKHGENMPEIRNWKWKG